VLLILKMLVQALVYPLDSILIKILVINVLLILQMLAQLLVLNKDFILLLLYQLVDLQLHHVMPVQLENYHVNNY
jgi:hypothetical protein